MNPPADFWVKAGAGIVVGIFAIVLERVDAANSAKHAKNQGADDDVSPWYGRTMVYAVAGVWIAVIFSTTADFMAWRSDGASASRSAKNEGPDREGLQSVAEGTQQLPDLRNNIGWNRQPSNYSPTAIDQDVVRLEGTTSSTQNASTDNSGLVLPPASRVIGVVRDESDTAFAAAELAKSQSNAQPAAVDESPKIPRRPTPLAHPFRPKSASLTINVDPNGPLLKEWYAETTQTIQAALSKGRVETGSGFIVVSDSGGLEFSRACSKHGEATVEYRNGKLVSARFDDHSVFVHPNKGHVRSWVARGPELRFGFRSPVGNEAWFETFTYSPADPNKGDTSFVASLYPEDKRIQLKISCKLAVNSAYSDVGIDELDGGTLTISTPLGFWQKRPMTIDLGNSIAMSSESALADSKSLLVAIDHADRGIKIEQDELGWYQVTLPLKKEDLKAMRS